MRPKLAMLRTKASRAAARALTGACAMPAVRQMFSRAPLQQQRRWMSAAGLPEGDKMWYMLGVEIAGQMGDLQKDINADNEIKAFMQGIEAQFAGTVDRGVVNAANGQALAQVLAGRREERLKPELEAQAEATKASNAQLVVGTQMKEGVKKMPSGLLIETLKEGSGAAPSPDSSVKVHYTGKLANGKVFDSSVERGEPATFAVSQVVKGFAEVILTMAPELAYGPAAVGPIPANSALQFEVELPE